MSFLEFKTLKCKEAIRVLAYNMYAQDRFIYVIDIYGELSCFIVWLHTSCTFFTNVTQFYKSKFYAMLKICISHAYTYTEREEGRHKKKKDT